MDCKVNPSTDIKVDLVARWDNGQPIVAIRYDLPGLITSITPWYGNRISNLQIIVNSLVVDAWQPN